MGSVGNTQVVQLPSDIVKLGNRKYNDIKMMEFNINGNQVLTNYGAYKYPSWDGNSRPTKYTYTQSLGLGDTTTNVFNDLVERGYNEIRFVDTTTRIRGFHKTYVWARRR